MSIEKRRERIRQIIQEVEINTQGELARLLTQEGFSVTQATVSRDIKELGLIKERGKILKYKYAEPKNTSFMVTEEKVSTLLKAFIVSVKSSGNLIVVKTLEGHASACGMAIDKLAIGGVIGSVAGDDTLLIVAEEGLTLTVEEIIKGYVRL
jgi:transcriptional regulator of arginine metabolism